MIIKRKIETLLKSRLKETSPLIQVLIGPRQVGKTTAIRGALQGFHGVFQSADSPVPATISKIPWEPDLLKRAGIPTIGKTVISKLIL